MEFGQRSVDFGLKDFYVLRDTGECVFHRSYANDEERIDADGTLMSSFLSAINAFAQNVDTGTKLLETDNYRFVYHKNQDYLYVARTEKKSDPNVVSSKLNEISRKMENTIPKKFDGNVKIFQGVTTLVQEEFSSNGMNNYYEITGKGSTHLTTLEEKIYSFLRFKGRSQLSSIVRLMKISEDEVMKVTQKLLDKEFVSSCS